METDLIRLEMKKHFDDKRIVEEIVCFLTKELEKSDNNSLSFESLSGQTISVIPFGDNKGNHLTDNFAFENEHSTNSNVRETIENLQSLNFRIPKTSYLSQISEVENDEDGNFMDNGESEVIQPLYSVGQLDLNQQAFVNSKTLRSSDYSSNKRTQNDSDFHYISEVNTSKTSQQKLKINRKKAVAKKISGFFKGIKNFFIS